VNELKNFNCFIIIVRIHFYFSDLGQIRKFLWYCYHKLLYVNHIAPVVTSPYRLIDAHHIVINASGNFQHHNRHFENVRGQKWTVLSSLSVFIFYLLLILFIQLRVIKHIYLFQLIYVLFNNLLIHKLLYVYNYYYLQIKNVEPIEPGKILQYLNSEPY